MTGQRLPLPIDPLLPEIVASLAARPALVLEAPPGAGKTTRVPRALYEADPSGREVVVLEPRRIAARMAARRVAEELGEDGPGGTVGYQVRFEDVSSSRTRVRFVTEAILTRRLLSDPELRGVGTVVLDEFHERHLHGDVALAWVRALSRTTRPDLRLVVMSATLDAEPAARFLDAPTLRAEGRRFDVTIEHLDAPDDRQLALQVVSAVRSALRSDGSGTGDGQGDGHVLVFLPGAGEIRRAAEALEKLAEQERLLVLPLHGDLPPAEQDKALARSDRRKVILSTNVAESSVTIEGVVAVVDSGLARTATHDPWSGLPRLEVTKISRSSAVQRAGRAGRTRAGRCLRLYTRGDFDRRPEHDPPEMRRADLAQLILELYAAGRADLEMLDPPAPAARDAAEELLARLGAVAGGKLTDVGRAMMRFPLHPRQARLLVEAERRGVVDDAAVIAAMLAERDLRTSTKARFGGDGRRGGGPPTASGAATERSDLLAMLDAFREAETARFSHGATRAAGLEPGATAAVDRAQKQLRRIARERPDAPHGGEDDLLACVLAGYPDRVAKRLRAGGRALALAGGGSAELSEESLVRDAEWMVAVGADAAARGAARVRVASGIEPEWLIDLFADRIVETDRVELARPQGRVEAVSRMTYDGLVLGETTLAPDGRPGPALAERIARVLADAAVAEGPDSFAPEGALARWLSRARFAAEVEPALAAPTEDDVRAALVEMCEGKRSFAELRASPVSLLDVVQSRLDPVQRARIEKLAPDRVTLGGGRSVRVTYEPGKSPWIASRLQDFFGMKDTPKVGGGRVPLVVHLLAPNQRAVQVTSDLAGFWERHYPQIRKELARKYPRHAWPERPQ